MSGRFPDFIVIGAMKSATSSLHSQLAAQSGFFMSSPKEPNFFSDPDIWARGTEWYRSLFAQALPGDLCGESSTHYTKLPDLPDTVARLHAHMPAAKLIYVMRDPIERLISHYCHGWLERSIDGSIDSAIERYPSLIDYSRYAMQIAPWLDAFGPEAILPVFSERLHGYPQAELERICRFLGCPDTPIWRADIKAQNVSSGRLRESRWRDAIAYAPVVTVIRQKLVPQRVRDRIKRAWQMDSRPVLGPAALAGVTKIFDADLAVLGEMLDTPISCATFAAVAVGKPLQWAARADSVAHARTLVTE